ncbi:MAG: HAMP domain-containing methyl-accepting chemotaxis protein [Myxococcota bacterium]|nr:HAMP domain-containing methyl-accepting chemotaxis protein [Myxococcota bacterium]
MRLLESASQRQGDEEGDLVFIANFEQYFSVAYATTERLVAGQSGDDVDQAIAAMDQLYGGIRSTLVDRTTQASDAIDEAFRNAENASNTTKWVTVISAILFFAAIWGLSRWVIKGTKDTLATVSQGFARLSAGNFTQQFPVTTDDQFGDLARKANAMMETLGTLIQGVLDASEHLSSAANELSAAAQEMENGALNQSSSSEQTSSAMVEMAAQIDQVAQSAHDLAATVDELATSVQEIAATSTQVEKNADALVASVEENTTTIRQMTASISSIAGSVKVVEEESRIAAQTADEGGRELSQVIEGIGESGRDIGKILRIIEEIADQTNLLALNAAIEAARAGEVGRGFAVVAEEVRRLAERSVDSTREIGTVVQTVQKDTSQAVDLTQSVLERIVNAVTKTSDLVTEVHAATEEQSLGADRILSTTENMRHLTQKVAEAAREQANGTRSITDAVEHMNGMTQQVASATSEQKRGGDMVVRAIEEIANVGHQNLVASRQVTETTSNLVTQADDLRQLAQTFKVR